jgi:anti-sigma regulatory factor (Ser/Thr protein kinase)
MSSSEPGDSLEWKFPATLKNVEQICSAAAQALEKYALNKKDSFAVELLLRESLNNAVIHGCLKNPRLSFSCSLLISGQEIIIEVSDDGAGFDWRKKPEVIPASSDETGRGLHIYAFYADSIEFNDAGNRVRLTRILKFSTAGDSQGEKNG